MRTWRPPLAEIGTGRHAVAVYRPNSTHGALRCRRTVGGCREGERGSAAPSRGAAVMAPCVAEAAGLQHPQRLQHRASPLAAHSRWLFPH